MSRTVAPRQATQVGHAAVGKELLDQAGPLEQKPLGGFYYLTFSDPSWPKKEQDSYLAPHGILLSTTIHEVYPGAYQIPGSPRRARARARARAEPGLRSSGIGIGLGLGLGLGLDGTNDDSSA